MTTKQPDRVALATLPTPLVRLRRLENELGGGAAIWVKRDDLTGMELSGNKIRKLEYIAAEALAGGFDTLVTEGTPQSNHCRATAAVCAKLGLQSRLLFRPPSASQTPLGNHMLDTLFGAQTRVYTRERYSADRDRIVNENLDELRAAGHVPRFMPVGASEPLGCWGYIRAAAELAEQLQQSGVGDCDVLAPVSSGGTYAGLVLGQRLHRLDQWRVRAVPVSDDVAYHRRAVGGLCRATIEQFDLKVTVDDDALAFIDGYVGEGYAIPYDACLDALRLLARVEGILLDPVYTAKAFCALLDGVRDGQLGRDRPVVFIHTGGIFSNFAWPERLVAGRR